MPRTINYEGRAISVPDDFSDDEVSAVLAGGSPQAAPVAQAPAPVPQPAPGATPAPPISTPTGQINWDDPAAVQPPAAPSQPAAPAAIPGVRGLQVGAQGAARGLGEAVFGPADLLNTGVNLGLAGIDRGSQALGGPKIDFRFPMPSHEAADLTARGAESIGIPVIDPETMTTNEKLGYNINRMGVNVAAPVPLLARAGAARATEIASGNSAPKLYDSIVRPYGAEASGRTIMGDAAGAAGAGAGVTLAEQLAPDSPIAQLFGVLGGGLGGVTALSVGEGAGRIGAMGVRKAVGANVDREIPVDPQTGLPTHKFASKEAARVVQQEATDKESSLARIFENVAALQPYLSKLPSSAALAEDPGLAALERQVNRPTDTIARNREFQTGVRDTVDRIAPEGATTEPLIQRAQSEIETRRNAAQETVDRAERGVDRLGRVRAGQGQEVSDYAGRQVPASQALDEQIVNQALEPMDAARRRRYQEAPNVQLPGEQFYDAAQGIRAGAETLPPSARQSILPENRLADFESLALREDPENPNRITGYRDIGSQDLERIRPQISQEVAAARKNNAPPELIDNLRRVQDTINDVTRELPANAEANRFYNEDYAPVFGREAGEAYNFRKDVNKDRMHRTASPPSETAGRFLQPDSPETTRSLDNIFRSMPDPSQAQAAAREYLMSDLAGKNVIDQRTGALRPVALRQWAQKNDANLNIVPGFRAEVTDLIDRAGRGEAIGGRFADQLREARTSQGITEDTINRSALRQVVDADPDKAVAAIMSNPNSSGRRLKELIDLTEGDEAARNGLKAAVRDFIVDKATNTASEKLVPGDSRGPVSFAKLTKVFNEHEKELAQVFSPEEMNTLRAGHKALELANVERLRATTGSDTMEKSGYFDRLAATPLGKGVDAFLRLKYGILKAGGLRATARRIVGGIGKDDANEVTRLVERATVDPELMGLLLGRKLPVGSPRWNIRLNALIGVKEAGGAAADGDEE
jgi:hypothetical protein